MKSHSITCRTRITAVFALVSVIAVQSLASMAVALTWQDVAADLMSPACPGRTLINCTSGQAEQWREIIRQKLAQGETKEQIMQYFVEMRGEEILAAPPKHGFALTAWLFPFFIILNGVGLVIILTCKWARKRSSKEESSVTTIGTADAATATEKLPPDPYRERLQRELEDFTA